MIRIFNSLENGIKDYVENYLSRKERVLSVLFGLKSKSSHFRKGIFICHCLRIQHY